MHRPRRAPCNWPSIQEVNVAVDQGRLVTETSVDARREPHVVDDRRNLVLHSAVNLIGIHAGAASQRVALRERRRDADHDSCGAAHNDRNEACQTHLCPLINLLEAVTTSTPCLCAVTNRLPLHGLRADWPAAATGITCRDRSEACVRFQFRPLTPVVAPDP